MVEFPNKVEWQGGVSKWHEKVEGNAQHKSTTLHKAFIVSVETWGFSVSSDVPVSLSPGIARCIYQAFDRIQERQMGHF